MKQTNVSFSQTKQVMDCFFGLFFSLSLTEQSFFFFLSFYLSRDGIFSLFSIYIRTLKLAEVEILIREGDR